MFELIRALSKHDPDQDVVIDVMLDGEQQLIEDYGISLISEATIGIAIDIKKAAGANGD